MTDQEREEFEFRLRAEQEAEQAKDGVSKFEEYTGVSPSSPLLGGAVGVVAGIPAGRILEGAAKGATAPLPRTTVAGKTGASSGDKWLRNYANINKPNFSGGVPEAASIYQRTKGHGPVSEKVTQRFGPGAKLDIESYSRAQKARPFSERVLSKTPEAVQRAGQAISGAGASVPAWMARGIAGGSAGFQGVDAANRFEQGDYLGAAIGGLGALGSGAALIPHPLTRGLGTAVGTAAPFINEYLDRRRKRQEEQPEESAEGVFGFSEGGGTPKKRVAKAIVDTAVGKTPKALTDIFEGSLNLAKKFGYDPKKISADYPDVIPPVLTTDKKTGKEFLQKQLSKEAIAVQNARKAAQAEIDAGKMINPYFDITKREYVDPSNYPLKGRTLTDVVPKKAETISKYEKLASDPGAQNRLMEAYNLGKDKPLAKDWYAMKQLEDKFIEELGPEAGRNAFRSRFAEPMAATTGGADPNSNLMMVAYTNMMREKGLPIPANAFDLPFPIGGRYVSGNMDQARKYHEMGSIPIDNPKRHNFASNFMGYRDRPTIDEQMMGLFAPGKGAPEPGTYGVYEAQLNKLAKEAGVNPVNFQDVAWAGAKKYSGKPMMQEINEMLYRTGRITGEDPETILKGYIRGNKPMYGLTGLGGLQVLDNEKDSE